jgi:hypothetical protein
MIELITSMPVTTHFPFDPYSDRGYNTVPLTQRAMDFPIAQFFTANLFHVIDREEFFKP